VKTQERPAPPGSPDDAPEAKGSGNPILRFLGEIPGLILMALVLAIIIKTFVVQAFYIPSESMEPTLLRNDRVLVSKIPYYLGGEPGRGDVIVFEEPDPAKRTQEDRGLIGGAFHWLIQKIGVEQPDNPDYIKRVIGVPGDKIKVRDGQVYVNGEAIDEPYIEGAATRWPAGAGTITVPEGSLFVMGDNRGDSLDSRYGLGVRDPEQGDVGFIPVDAVVGKAFVIVWPLDRMGGLAGP
jgi:signal peptidase I